MTQSEILMRQRGVPGVQAQKYTLQGYAETTDATSTSVIEIPVPEGATIHVWLQGVGTIDDMSASLSIISGTSWRRAPGGVPTSFGSGGSRWQDEDHGGSPTVITLSDSVSKVLIQATGIAAENWSWYMTVEVVELILP